MPLLNLIHSAAPLGTTNAETEVFPALRLDHLKRLTDDTGLMQHATFTLPNRFEGYATDDNARALMVAVALEQLAGQDGLPAETQMWALDCSFRYLAFLQHALNPANGRFRNFLSYDRRWTEAEGSEDSHGRSLWALGTALRRSTNPGLKNASERLFDLGLPAVLGFRSPRAYAYALLGIRDYLACVTTNAGTRHVQAELAHRLLDMYEACRGTNWKWFEDIVAYGNARLPQALLATGAQCGDDRMITVALESLEWLMEIQRCPEKGHFAPIGSLGFYPRGGRKANFDQQPLEATGAIATSLEAYGITGERRWRRTAWFVFPWFLGANDLQMPLYDAESGGCRDGLHPDRVNQNQGAESTLSFLMAWLDLYAIAETSREDAL